jgi:serine/threonine protein kinase/WD40 repeat protein
MLAPGTRIGVYEVITALGAGGMGEVYRARDTKLHRDVALKVLPRQLASDPSSLERFEREARQIASLNHPNIVAIFDTGTHGDVAYIVTELVDGATLRGTTWTVRKAAEIGAQVADALAAAHRAGVTHRDVKPDNVMVASDGRVKLLDFGIAKPAVEPEGVTVAHTSIGSTLGTPGYMAPEQVRGGVVDQRTDIFALGVLLYEMLAGAAPFKRDTPPEMLTATLHADPPDLPAGIPEAFQRVVRRCLEKNPNERFQSAEDLAFALRQLTETSRATAASDVPPSAPTPSRAGGGAARITIAAGAFLLGAFAAAAVFARWTAQRDSHIDPIQLTRISSDRRDEVSPRISPDGRSLAYLRTGGGVTEVLVRPLDSPDAVTVARSNMVLYTPVWSPDSNQVCYRDVHRDFWCVGAAGGSPQRVLQDVTWAQIAPNGRDIYFIRVFENRPWLYRSASGGNPARVGSESWPLDSTGLSPVSPDGSSLIVTLRSGCWLVSLPGGERRAIPSDPSARTTSIAWLPDSRHIAAVEETTTLIGSRIVIEDLRSAARRLVFTTADDVQSVTATPDGTALVYAGGAVERDIVEYTGDGQLVRSVAASSLLEGFPSWARRGDRFVYRAGGPGQVSSLWMGTPDGSPPRLVQRLTDSVVSQTPISPDGARIAYADSTGIYVIAATGGRAVRVLATTNAGAALCWSPDGDWIWYSERPTGLGRVPSGGGHPQPINASPAILTTCSPDGRWLLRRSETDFVVTSADGKTDRPIARADEYATRGNNVGDLSGQFSGDSSRVYMLRVDRRTIDVFDVASGRKLRSIAFNIPVEDHIESFSFDPDGTRVLLTTGGDRDDLWMVKGFAQPAASWRRWFMHWEAPER